MVVGAGRPLAHHYPSPDARHAQRSPWRPHGRQMTSFKEQRGFAAVAGRPSACDMLNLAPERRCRRRRHAYAARNAPQLRHKDASVVETRWVEARRLRETTLLYETDRTAPREPNKRQSPLKGQNRTEPSMDTLHCYTVVVGAPSRADGSFGAWLRPWASYSLVCVTVLLCTSVVSLYL